MFAGLLGSRWIILGVAFAAVLAFAGIQTWNLRACQRYTAQVIATYSAAIQRQNDKVADWEKKAKEAQTRAALAGKQAQEATKIANERIRAILGAAKPSGGASCEEREHAVLELIRGYRAP